LNVIESTDTAACAKRVKEQHLTDTVAIANQLAAKTYGLDILERRIESNKKNYTRFLILTDNKENTIEGADKASLSFQVINEAGSLVKVLNIFAENNINMSKIQSMPVLGQRNQYNFYVDVEWENREDYEEAIRKALRYTINFTIMGEYKKNESV